MTAFDGPRLAVAFVLTLGLFWLGGVIAFAVYALFNEGWWFSFGVIAFIAMVAVLYRMGANTD